jgi:hypothetical protein
MGRGCHRRTERADGQQPDGAAHRRCPECRLRMFTVANIGGTAGSRQDGRRLFRAGLRAGRFLGEDVAEGIVAPLFAAARQLPGAERQSAEEDKRQNGYDIPVADVHATQSSGWMKRKRVCSRVGALASRCMPYFCALNPCAGDRSAARSATTASGEVSIENQRRPSLSRMRRTIYPFASGSTMTNGRERDPRRSNTDELIRVGMSTAESSGREGGFPCARRR